LVESQIVILVVVGSSPISHPKQINDLATGGGGFRAPEGAQISHRGKWKHGDS
jgi:hypothetical protein